MAIGITLLFILAELLGPKTLFGPLAEFRIELIVTVLAILATIPSIASSGILQSRMLLCLCGMITAAALSIVSSGWIAGIYYVGYGYLPFPLGFVLVAVNCRTKLHLQLVALVLFCGCAFDVTMGYRAVLEGGTSVYVYGRNSGEEPGPGRIRGEQFIADPNDFAQLMVALTPLMFSSGDGVAGSSIRHLSYPPLRLCCGAST